MEKKEGYVQTEIHNTSYEQKYRETILNSEGLISTSGRNVELLDGKWNFSEDWYDTCRRAEWYLGRTENVKGVAIPLDWDWEGWERIDVPSCWNMVDPRFYYFEGSGLYTRTFGYVKQKENERVFLRFEGASYRTTVFINGVCKGTHDGASTPFCAEITNDLKKENRIIVSIEARRRNDRLPMENTDWFNYGGLYRSIKLVRVPETFIKDYFIRLVPDGTYSSIAVDVNVASPNNKASGTVNVAIPELNISEKISVKDGCSHSVIKAKPELWSPKNPRLYKVEISFTPEGKNEATDCICEKIGFREIKVKGKDVLLNGEPIFLKGISVHEDHIELGKTTNEVVIRQTIKHIKELNGCFLRLAHYPHTEMFSKIADEEGILLWEEIPVYWAIDFENPVTVADAQNQLAELISRDKNRASVIIWSVGNENPDTDARLKFMSDLADKAHSMDETRPVSAACLVNKTAYIIDDRLAEKLDIIGVNEYYGWYEPVFTDLITVLENSKIQKPVIITEFGAGALAGHHGSVTDFFTEERQKWVYEQQVKVIGGCEYIKGCTPWILYDFRCPRRENRYQQGFNRKGLISSDRLTKKAAFDVLKEFYKTK